MSIIPFFRRHNKGNNTTISNHPADDYNNIEIWDQFESFPFSMPIVMPITTGQMDWKETPGAHVFIADMPGVKKEEIKIEVEEEKILKISGQRFRGSEEKHEKWHRAERYVDKFHRGVKLPPNTSLEGAKAVLENGVLTVVVPKVHETKAQGWSIPIAG